MEKQRILVTGGAGLIGTNLVNELRSRSHEVIALDLLNNDRENYIRADTKNYRQLERFFERSEFDYIHHLAAEYGRWNGEDYYESLWQTNVIGIKHMLRLQEETCILGVPCVTFRKSTERPETIDVGSNVLAGTDPQKIVQGVHQMIDAARSWNNPYGSGNAGKEIIHRYANRLDELNNRDIKEIGTLGWCSYD